MNDDRSARFLDDRFALSDAEFDAWLDALRTDAEARRALQEQLTMDDVLSRALDPDRANFRAQVLYRVHDAMAGTRAIRERRARILTTIRGAAGRDRARRVRRVAGWLALGAAAAAGLRSNDAPPSRRASSLPPTRRWWSRFGALWPNSGAPRRPRRERRRRGKRRTRGWPWQPAMRCGRANTVK